MGGVLVGFAIIAAIIATGWLIGRINLLGKHAPMVLARLVYFVLAPALLFTILAESPVERLFSEQLAIAGFSALAAFLVFAAVALFLWRRRLPETIIGSLSAGYVNANNIGIPVAAYVLGDAGAPAPIILLQLLILAPVALALLDLTTARGGSKWALVTRPLRNPILIGSALGVVVSVTGMEIPAPVMEPFLIVGAAAVPLMLINFGISLHGRRILEPGSGRRDILLASAIKMLVMPFIAWVLGRFVFHLEGQDLFIAVGLAALPSAQNVFNFAQMFGRGVIIARDTVLITTLGSLPVLLLIALLLG